MDAEQLAAEFRMARGVVLRLADKIHDASHAAHASLIAALGRIYDAERLLLPNEAEAIGMSPRAMAEVVR